MQRCCGALQLRQTCRGAAIADVTGIVEVAAVVVIAGVADVAGVELPRAGSELR